MLLSLMEINVLGVNVVQVLLYFVLAILIKLVLDMISVPLYTYFIMRRKHGEQVPVGAREAFKYLYKSRVRGTWQVVIAAVVLTIVWEYNLFRLDWQGYVLGYTIIILLLQGKVARDIYKWTEQG